MAETMRAMILKGHGGPEQFEFREDWPVPEPGPMQVLIRVGACGVNNTDINTRVGWYSKSVTEATNSESTDAEEIDSTWGGNSLTFPRIQGADAVGTVVALGHDVAGDWLNQRVMVGGWVRDWDDPMNGDKVGYFGSECDGGFAEYTVADIRGIAPVNSDYSDEQLATFSCSYVTAEGMLQRAAVTNTDTVLITGASGGVGSALIQLAKMRGARTIALAGQSKHAAMAPLDADLLLDRWPNNLTELLAAENISVIADVVGGPNWSELIDLLERRGRYVSSGAIAGPIVDLDLRTLYLRDLTLIGSTVTEPGDFMNVVKYIESSKLKPLVSAVFPLEQLIDAQEKFTQKDFVGNIVIKP